jgi:lysophospholipase
MGEPAPLVSVPEAPGPPGGVAEWYLGADKAKLRAALFTPAGAVRGSVILSPGRTEPIEKYFEVVGEFLVRGFVVLVHDWRGQGLSARAFADRMPGHARGWRPFLSDYNRMIAAFETRLPKPWIAVGHSMGGGLTALALAEGESRFSAAVLCAPMLGLNLGKRKPGEVGLLASVMSLIGRAGRYAAPPVDPLDETFEGNVLTHDPARYERYHAILRAEPDLKISGPTYGWVLFALTLAARVKASRRIDALPIPLTIVAAGEERLCLNAASEAVAKRAPKGRLVLVSGAYHEILMETDDKRAQFWTAFDETTRAL